MARSTFVYVTYIRTTPEKLWSAPHTIERDASQLIAAVSGGWPKVLSNLKSLLETGSPVLQDPYPTSHPQQMPTASR